MEGGTAVKRNVGSEESPGENGHRMSETHLLVRNLDETVKKKKEKKDQLSLCLH